MSMGMGAPLWYRDRSTLRLLAFGYLPWLAGLNLVWEIAQLPLYTIWTDASAGFMAFAVAHCTLGDLLIGSAALLISLIAGGGGASERWRWRRIALGTALIGAGYTVFSEWMNLTVLQSWAYSEWMPVIEFAGLRTGLSPLLQWLVVPPLALSLARKTCGGGKLSDAGRVRCAVADCELAPMRVRRR